MKAIISKDIYNYLINELDLLYKKKELLNQKKDSLNSSYWEKHSTEMNLSKQIYQVANERDDYVNSVIDKIRDRFYKLHNILVPAEMLLIIATIIGIIILHEGALLLNFLFGASTLGGLSIVLTNVMSIVSERKKTKELLNSKEYLEYENLIAAIKNELNKVYTEEAQLKTQIHSFNEIINKISGQIKDKEEVLSSFEKQFTKQTLEEEKKPNIKRLQPKTRY